MPKQLKYPEMQEYEWVKDLDRVTRQSKFEHGKMTRVSELPKVPLSLALQVMEEAASRVEVMEAYASASPAGQIPDREKHLLIWHNEYLRHKYGNRPDPIKAITVAMRNLANGVYKGLSDPALIGHLTGLNFVVDDRGAEDAQ